MAFYETLSPIDQRRVRRAAALYAFVSAAVGTALAFVFVWLVL